MSETIRKRIGEALILTVYVVFDFRDEWPKNHIFALTLAVIAFSSILLIEFRCKIWAIATTMLIVIAAVILLAAPPVVPEETEYHGWLVPANDPTPPNKCIKQKTNQANTLLMLFGGTGVFMNGDQRFEVLNIGGHDTIDVQKSHFGLLVNVDLLDAYGNLAMRIEDNEFHVIPGQTSFSKRPDRSTLLVNGKNGDELFWVRYLNPQTVQIRGVFHKVGDETPILVTNDKVTIGKAPTGLPPCFMILAPVPGTAITFN
jgi:hypothetical protein